MKNNPMPRPTMIRLVAKAIKSALLKGRALYQVLVFSLPNRLSSMAQAMVSILSRLSKIRGTIIFELALILFVRLALSLISMPLAWLACLISKYDFCMSGIYLRARATA